MSDIVISKLIADLISLIFLFAIILWLFFPLWNKVNKYFAIFIMLFTFLPILYHLLRMVSCSLLRLCTIRPEEVIVLLYLVYTVPIGLIISVLALIFFRKTPTNVLPNSSIKPPVKGGRRV